MKVREIRIEAQTISGLTIDSTVSLNWIKGAIREIAYKYHSAAKRTSDDVSVNDTNKTYQLSKEVVKIDRIRRQGQAYSSYEIIGDHGIEFQHSGEYSVRYYSVPEMPMVENSDVDLPEMFADSIKFYIASRMRARLFGQDDSSAVSFYQEFLNGISDADSYMRRRDSRKRMPPGIRR